MARDCGLGVGTLVIIERVRWRERLAFLHLRFDLGEEFYHRDASGGKAPCSGSRAPRVVESRRPATRRERVIEPNNIGTRGGTVPGAVATGRLAERAFRWARGSLPLPVLYQCLLVRFRTITSPRTGRRAAHPCRRSD